MSWRGENTEKGTYWCDPYILVLISIMRKRKDERRMECMLSVTMEMIKWGAGKYGSLEYSFLYLFWKVE